MEAVLHRSFVSALMFSVCPLLVHAICDRFDYSTTHYVVLLLFRHEGDVVFLCVGFSVAARWGVNRKNVTTKEVPFPVYIKLC